MDAAKRCSKCGLVKPWAEFTRDGTRSDGRYPSCKACKSASGRAYRARPEVRERRRSADKAYYQENRPHILDRVKSYQEANPERIAAYQAEYYAAHKDELSAYKVEYRTENLERIHEYDRLRDTPERRRRHYLTQTLPRRAHGIRTAIAPEDIDALFASYGNRCLCCGVDGKLEIDHVVPLSKGGKHELSNLQPLCRSCNASKGAKDYDYRVA